MALIFEVIRGGGDNLAYIVGCSSEKTAAVVDPVCAHDILEYCRDRKVNILYILNTHGHPDHTAGNDVITGATNARIMAHPGDRILNLDKPLAGTKMKRKRLIWVLVAVTASWIIGSQGYAQMGMGPVGSGVCCNHGVPSIPANQKCELLHQVGPGENLHVLAAYYYGDARAWRRIYNLNKKQIKNPNKIVVGQVLRIEVAPCWSPRFDLQEFLRLEERRREIFLRAPGDRPRQIIKKEVVETKVTVTFEEEEGEEGAAPGEEKEEGGGGPTIEIEGGGEGE